MSQTNTPTVPRHWRHTVGLFAGPVAALLVLMVPWSGLSPQAHALSAIVALVVIFWLTEAIPLSVTALLDVLGFFVIWSASVWLVPMALALP